MSGRFWLISILSLMVALLIGGRWVLPTTINQEDIKETRDLWVGETKVSVEVVDEGDEMSKGLGYRDSLDEDMGMLFIYPESIVPTFWMKGMKFGLDFIWIRDGVVVEITKNIPPPINEEEQLPLIRPKELSDWILEVNAGWIEKNKVSVGDVVRFE